MRGYEQALRLRVVPDLGARRLSELGRNDFQDLIDRLVSKGVDPSTVRNTLMPARAIFRRAMTRGDVAINPTTGLELPAVRGVRERIATPDEAVALIDAVPIADGALWATAMYAGLRLGELVALDWSAVDCEVGVIPVERSWDPKEGVIEPKSRRKAAGSYRSRQVCGGSCSNTAYANVALARASPSDARRHGHSTRPPCNGARASPGAPPTSPQSRRTSAGTPSRA